MEKNKRFKELQRVHLWGKIEESAEAPLMLVVAPIGYGKSFIVRDFLEKKPPDSCVWISMGQESVDDEWVWHKICQKTAVRNPELAEQLRELGLPTERQNEDLLLELIEENMKERNFYIVLDDYHECNSPVINRLIAKVTYEDIPFLHIILIGRFYMDIPFEEMMLKGYCRIIEQKELTLSKEETNELFLINGVSLDEGALNRVYAYTDGWIAAAYLVWLDYKRNGVLQFSTSILHLLRESVYNKLPEKVQNILMAMSLFGEFSLEEAAAVTGNSINQVEFEHMAGKLGFIHYDSQNKRYSMHALLRSVAGEEMKSSGMKPRELFGRYAAYQEEHKNVINAVAYYRKAGSYESVFRLLDSEERGGILDQIPQQLFYFFSREVTEVEALYHPTAYLSFIYAMIMQGTREVSDEGRRMFTRAKKYYMEFFSGKKQFNELKGELMIIEALTCFNDLSKINACMQEAWELRQGKPSQIFQKKIFTYGVPETLYMYHWKPGSLLKTVELEKTYSQYYMRLLYNIDGGWEGLIDAEYYLETGEIDRAYSLAAVTSQKSKYRKQICVTISCYEVILRALIYRGDREEFDLRVAELNQEMKDINRLILTLDYDQVRGHIYGMLGHLDKMPIWLRERRLDACNQIVREVRGGCIANGIFLCKKKQWVLLEAIAEEMSASYSGTRHVFSNIYSHIYKAVALSHLNQIEKAEENLIDAFALAEPDRVKMPFIENAEELYPILEALSKRAAYAKTLLPLCKEWLSGVKAFSKEKWINVTFTPREQELMTLLSEGYRNTEISKKLNIALVTVEKNLTNIYRKIGVTNRTGAIAWYVKTGGGGRTDLR